MTTLLQAKAKPPPKTFDHLSFSAVSTFQACPLRFYFRYVLGLPQTVISSSLVFGSAMHHAVQFHYEQLMIGNKPPDLDMLLDAYQDYWEGQKKQTIRFGKGEDRDALGRMADRMLRAFMASGYAQPQGVILGVEEELRGQLVPGCPDLLARLDLIVDTGSELIVSDFKTSHSSWSCYKVDDVSPQLLLYSELVKPMADGRPIKLSFAVLTKTKLPVLTVHDVPLDAQQMNRTKGTVEQVWKAIQAGHFFPNPSPLNCGTCPFRNPCRQWTG
jgi:putative RecB family exonuclease